MTTREPRSTRFPRARAAAAGLALWIGAGLAGVPALAEQPAPVIYQWTDDRGNVRYTPDPERVPASRRDTMLRLEPGAPATPQPPRPDAPSVPSPAPTALTTTPVAPSGVTPAPAQTPVATPASTPTPTSAPTAAGVADTTPRAGAPSAPAPELSPSETAREQQLAAAIAADEEALKALISAPAAEGGAPAGASEQLREIARRLPAMQAELSALRERRAPPAGP
jgi:hypothetical protein